LLAGTEITKLTIEHANELINLAEIQKDKNLNQIKNSVTPLSSGIYFLKSN